MSAMRDASGYVSFRFHQHLFSENGCFLFVKKFKSGEVTQIVESLAKDR